MAPVSGVSDGFGRHVGDIGLPSLVSTCLLARFSSLCRVWGALLDIQGHPHDLMVPATPWGQPRGESQQCGVPWGSRATTVGRVSRGSKGSPVSPPVPRGPLLRVCRGVARGVSRTPWVARSARGGVWDGMGRLQNHPALPMEIELTNPSHNPGTVLVDFEVEFARSGTPGRKVFKGAEMGLE